MPSIRNLAAAGIAATLVALALLVLAPTAGAYIYWGNFVKGTIGRAENDGSGVNPSFISGAGTVQALAVDSSHLYWANQNGNAIGRANLDGTGVEPQFIPGIAMPSGVAVTATSIYWSSVTGHSIGKAKIDGSSPQPKLVSGLFLPCGVGVDAGHVYWGEDATGTPAFIGRAGLDGSVPEAEFIEIPGTSFPCGVAVDSVNVFWSEPGFLAANGTRIGRANKNTATSADPNFIGDASGPCGIARDGSHLYWSNGGNGTIARAGSDGTGVEEEFIPGVGGKEEDCGIAVDGLSSPPPSPPPAGPPAPDTRAPVAKISKGPGKKLGEGIAKFSFKSDEKGSSFRCRLDSKKRVGCTSPKIYRGLKPGRHTFRVWATDGAGNQSKPAKRSFRVPS
jgi:hypothetical protein